MKIAYNTQEFTLSETKLFILCDASINFKLKYSKIV